MTAENVFQQALALVGYTNAYGEDDPVQHASIAKRGLAFINQIYADLYRMEHPHCEFHPCESMDRQLALQESTCVDVMPYGVAMLLAQSENDGDSQALYAALYNQKRSRAVKPLERVCDVLPKIGCDWA